MTGAGLASGRRLLAVCRATAKDLGRGTAAASLVLLVLWCLGLQGEPEGVGAEGTARVRLEAALTATAALAGLAMVLATAWAFGEDRRTRRWQLWRVAPLHPCEFILGRVLGLWGGACAVVLPLCLLVLLVWPGSVARHPERFRPVEQHRPDDAGQGGGQAVRGGAVVLQGGDQRTFPFRDLPAARAVVLSLTPVEYDRSRAEDRPPQVEVRAGGRVLVARELPELPGIGARLDWGEVVTGDLQVTVRAGTGQGLLLMRPGDLTLEGRARSLGMALGRSLAGLAAWMLLLCCLVCVAGLLVSDVVALALGALAVLVLMGRGTLVEVCRSVSHMDEHVVSLGVRRLAAGLGGALRMVPDGGAVVGGRLLARGQVPGSVEDGATWGLLAAWCLIAALVAAAIFGWRRRSAP